MKTFALLWQYFAKFFFEWETFYTEVAEKSKHTFYTYVQHFSLENRAVYAILSENVVEPEGLQVTSQYGAYALHAG